MPILVSTPEVPVPSTPSAETPSPEIPSPATPSPRHGEFIMAGDFTATGPPEAEFAGEDLTTMPNYAHRKEVQAMLKKLRDSVSLWKRIPDPPPPSARDAVARFVLPQHTNYIK